MLPAALPATAGPTVVISVLPKQQHQDALGSISVHSPCLVPTERPELVRECPEGGLICSAFPSSLEKAVESFAFQQKNHRSPCGHYTFLDPPCVVSELVCAAISTFTSPFCAASSVLGAAQALPQGRNHSWGWDVCQKEPVWFLPSTQRCSVLCASLGAPTASAGAHTAAAAACPGALGWGWCGPCCPGWCAPWEDFGTGSQRGVSGTASWRQGSACEPSQAGRLGSQKQSERQGFGSLCRILPQW